MSHLLDVEEGVGSEWPPHLGTCWGFQGSALAGVLTAERGLRAQWGGTGGGPEPVTHPSCLSHLEGV